MLGDSLILMGEIGGNDYNYPFFERKTVNEIKELVPLIIKTISSAIVVTYNYFSLFYVCLIFCNNKLGNKTTGFGRFGRQNLFGTWKLSNRMFCVISYSIS